MESLSLRYFLVDEDDRLWRVSQRVAQELVTGRERLPQFANKTVRAIEVAIWLVGGEPEEVDTIYGSYWRFDATGRWFLDRRTRALIMGMVGIAEEVNGNVIPSSEFNRRLFRARERWDPTPRIVTEIVHSIWPEQAGRKVDLPPFIRGIRRRKPPMTYEAKQARRDLMESVITANAIIEDLSEPSLKALIANLEEADPDDFLEVWQGIVAACRRRLSIAQAKRREKGVWYAEVEAIRWEGAHYSGTGRTVADEHIKAASRKGAVKAGRDLLKKFAQYFDEEHTVEVTLWTGIEWERHHGVDSGQEK